MSIFKKVLSVGSGKLASELNTIVDEINDKEQEFEKLSDEEIKTNFQNLSAQLNDNPFSIEVEAFAYIREAAKRTIGQRHYDVQILGGLVLLRNKITEMKTGEGKTLVSTLPLALNALTGRGVHVVTVNEYLAERDSQWMGHLFNFLNISVGCIFNQMPQDEKTDAYQKDITYGVNSRFCFDYLEDNMSYKASNQVQRDHVFAIVDEVDSVLIDEARTPMILSGQADYSSSNQQFNDWKSKIESLMRDQNNLVNKIVSEGEELLSTNEDEAGIKLLLATRGAPKNNKLLKLMQETGVVQLITKTENNFLRDKKMHELDENLFYSIDEKSGTIDLSEIGREKLSSSNPCLLYTSDAADE